MTEAIIIISVLTILLNATLIFAIYLLFKVEKLEEELKSKLKKETGEGKR